MSANRMSFPPLVEVLSIQVSFLPYHPTSALTFQPGEATTKVSCRLCEENIEKKVMRKHVGVHIFKENLGMVCGFCGLGNCSIDLARGFVRGKTT